MHEEPELKGSRAERDARSGSCAGAERLATDRLTDLVLDHLASVDGEGRRGPLRLYSVSKLTIASPTTDIVAAAKEVAARIADVAGQGAVFVLSRKKRAEDDACHAHLHGLVLADDGEHGEAVIGEWVGLTHADPKQQRIKHIRVSAESWVESEKPSLRKHVSNVLNYALVKNYDGQPLGERVFPSGVLAPLWDRVVDALGLDPRTPSTPARNASTQRKASNPRRVAICKFPGCGKSLDHMRADAETCGRSHRSRWHQLQHAKDPVSIEELRAVYAAWKASPDISERALAQTLRMPRERVRRALVELDDSVPGFTRVTTNKRRKR
jgi:hypothetical protein